MLNFDSGKSETEYSSHNESSTSKDLKALHQEDYMSSYDDCLPCQQVLSCENEGEEDDLYKIYSQFKELSINVIDNDKVIELLQIVKDLKIRAQIIDNIAIPPLLKIISQKMSLPKKQEINNLKDDFHRLKEKNVTIENRLDNIESIKDLGSNSETSSYEGDRMATMYFFMEFAIPWIMRWVVEVDNTEEVQKNLEGKCHGQETIDTIITTIDTYRITASQPEVDIHSPFK
ncbi:hypothetical protein H5410_046686 [Solanum commersonii]|uniref:Uncharacterized protein n=1 Tax=Solanum commersonii TaxID=4109 RepID=A0A9J5XG68_SOLCO|nr:hypothetical protein H5410_046686 [Solanum commersonii]